MLMLLLGSPRNSRRWTWDSLYLDPAGIRIKKEQMRRLDGNYGSLQRWHKPRASNLVTTTDRFLLAFNK
jgi:hypothetical protein